MFYYKSQFRLAFPLRHLSTSIAVVMLSLGIVGCGGEKESKEPTAIAVKLSTMESNTLVDSSEYVGTLEATDRVSLAPRTDGRIMQIFARQGDRVERGEPIVELEPTQEQENVNAARESVNVERARLGQNQAELGTAEANRSAAAAEVESARADLQDLEAEVSLAQTNIKRTQMLVEGGALPQQDLDDDNRDLKTSIAQRNSRKETLNAAIESLQASERQVEQVRATIDSQNATIKQSQAELGSISQNLAFNKINAPIGGIVGSFDDKKVGDYVSVGEELTTITNNQNFDLNINIPVEYRDRLKPGLKVETVKQDGSKGIEGKIAYVAPLVNQATQSILAKAAFSSSNSLRDREYVRVRVIWSEQPGLLVPTSAISTLGGQNFVYVAREKQAKSDANGEKKSESNNSEEKSESDSDSQAQGGKSGSEVPAGALIAAQQPVKLGSIQGQNYQIVSGLSEGDQIAVSNILSLKDGTQIKAAKDKQEQQANNTGFEAKTDEK